MYWLLVFFLKFVLNRWTNICNIAKLSENFSYYKESPLMLYLIC